MANNISQIINISSQPKIIKICGTKCDNYMVNIVHASSKRICKNCGSIVCDHCINYNKTKCGVCLAIKYGYCNLCKNKIKILPCGKCDNVLKKCNYDCKNYDYQFIHGNYGLICRICYIYSAYEFQPKFIKKWEWNI